MNRYLALLFSLGLAGCSHAAKPPPVTVVLIAPGAGSGYETYAAQARAGLDACAARTGAQVSAVTADTADETERQLILAATENTDAIIAIGYGAAPAVQRVAARFEKAQFALIGAVANGPNVSSILFDDAAAARLAGTLAGLASHTHRVAVLTGSNDAIFRGEVAGFIAGAHRADAGTAVKAVDAGTFEDAAAVERAAATLYADRYDVIYAIAGKASAGAVDAAKARARAYVIAADTDQNALAPGVVLASIVKNVDLAAARVCDDAVSQKPASGKVVLGAGDRGFSIVLGSQAASIAGAPALARLKALEPLP
jgi:basic membrane protein A